MCDSDRRPRLDGRSAFGRDNIYLFHIEDARSRQAGRSKPLLWRGRKDSRDNASEMEQKGDWLDPTVKDKGDLPVFPKRRRAVQSHHRFRQNVLV